MMNKPIVYEFPVYPDGRGFFAVTFNNETFSKEIDSEVTFVQDNLAYNKKAFTFRGFHWQEPPYDQAKLVRCTKGEIIDFVVDIRRGSTFGEEYHFHLKEGDGKYLFIPKGFAHAYITLADNTIVEYKIDNKYSKEHERGFYGIDIVVEYCPGIIPICSDKDLEWPKLNNIETNLINEDDIDEQ